MENEHQPDWQPDSADVTRDQRAAYDEMRRRCPVAHSKMMGWSVFQHEDVTRVLHDHETFSNAVSQHLSVPNGMDPPEHTVFRRIIEPYFSEERMRAFEPACRRISQDLVGGLKQRVHVEFMDEVASHFAVRVQCAFLGWPERLQEVLVSWMRRNQAATLAQDRTALSQIAREFEAIIDELIDTRLKAKAGPEQDLTAALIHEKVWNRTLSNEEVASILRNWTAGEIGTISASIGILAHYLATEKPVQVQLRRQRDLIPAATDEILRIHGPLVSNRRVTTRAVEIGGKKLGPGERITLNWISANRDEGVFEDANAFRLDRDPSKNLLYGAGIHVCPGAPLARLELRVFIEELLAATTEISINPQEAAELATYPASGYSVLPLQIV
jgi:cytochrome P450